jgi:hypothetical protein
LHPFAPFGLPGDKLLLSTRPIRHNPRELCLVTLQVAEQFSTPPIAGFVAANNPLRLVKQSVQRPVVRHAFAKLTEQPDQLVETLGVAVRTTLE